MKPYRAAPFAVAPLMDWTDRHCRFFHRILTRRALLYTEMVTTGAVIHGDRERLLGFSPEEHPVALQLGGSDPVELAAAARIGADYGYDEINLNVGCPSDRVQNGRFGACLMREPALVADCVAAMKAAVAIPVTVKCRIGVDEQDPEEALDSLTLGLVAVGVDGLVVHARKAWLQGLSPKENREIPPLDYGRVHRLKRNYPALPISLNGGLADVEAGLVACEGEGGRLDGMMLGRAAYQNPEILMAVDPLLYGEPAPVGSAEEAIDAYIPYVEARLVEGYRLNQMTRHLLGLFPGRPGARLYRRHLATEAVKPGAGVDVLRAAVAHVTEATARQTERAALDSAA
ncbi:MULTISPECIES: tRNA dihydrouridine(20/20a) synthase DusA [unclassified Chelatococcus]|uniref:tRNA dihydrouridine(20/20a) synthase DusA n=1 Tax=unclassified Chelatococcus TaxID=2638111 RepID=UPI001BCD321F|nr:MULTISPECIES: tRNA dihydrouridine(20/20a) synthase DusA [unclassified Chelatococcus]MBS7698524.1 tRNA dihydrouridine(20/20a) synthase DusA [Chelatococcus sp. YT9]MBX3554825.1 tRNA dihydrouridine(20/20a) synthase DusA [Chelatococcus sp.]